MQVQEMTTKCPEKVSINQKTLTTLPCSSHRRLVAVRNLAFRKVSFPILFFKPSKWLSLTPEPIIWALSMPLLLPLTPPVGCHIFWLPPALTQILFKSVPTQEPPTPCSNLDPFKNIVFRAPQVRYWRPMVKKRENEH